jgi:hypothetical protein
MANLKYSAPANAALAIFYDSEGDIIQMDPMNDGWLEDASGNRVEIVATETKLKDREAEFSATRSQKISSPEPDKIPSTTVMKVEFDKGCLWVDHGGRNVWRCP